jgi:hypothetical protein
LHEDGARAGAGDAHAETHEGAAEEVTAVGGRGSQRDVGADGPFEDVEMIKDEHHGAGGGMLAGGFLLLTFFV